MNQFKDVFLGKTSRDYSRAASSQKCIRVGGKHNDLDNVGHTKRHITFFEMLGNFSFGDYFKKETMTFAWEVATSIFNFPEEKLFVSIYEKDDEAFELWKEIVGEKKISRIGKKDNSIRFWMVDFSAGEDNLYLRVLDNCLRIPVSQGFGYLTQSLVDGCCPG